jgi:hypothetical protein
MKTHSMIRVAVFLSVGVMSAAGCAPSGGIRSGEGVRTEAEPYTIDPKSGLLIFPSWKGALTMEVELVSDLQGNRLAAGETGLCVLMLRNISTSPIDIRTVSFSGKADVFHSPSTCPDTSYTGIGIAEFSFSWSMNGAPGEWQKLAPPDDPINLAPDRIRYVARFIRAPKVPGVYELRVRLNTTGAVRALLTRNNVAPQDSEPIVVEGVISGVSIVDVARPSAAIRSAAW